MACREQSTKLYSHLLLLPPCHAAPSLKAVPGQAVSEGLEEDCCLAHTELKFMSHQPGRPSRLTTKERQFTPLYGQKRRAGVRQWASGLSQPPEVTSPRSRRLPVHLCPGVGWHLAAIDMGVLSSLGLGEGRGSAAASGLLAPASFSCSHCSAILPQSMAAWLLDLEGEPGCVIQGLDLACGSPEERPPRPVLRPPFSQRWISHYGQQCFLAPPRAQSSRGTPPGLRLSGRPRAPTSTNGLSCPCAHFGCCCRCGSCWRRELGLSLRRTGWWCCTAGGTVAW